MAQSDDIAEPKRLIAERRYGEAIVVCRKLLVTGEDRPEVRLLLGQALLAEERFDDVRVEMLSLVRSHSELGAAHRLLGEAFLRSGHKERADDALRRALELSPEDETARELLDELSEERFPVVQTIERWFGEEEARTVESALPAFTEEHTPVPGRISVREIAIPASTAPQLVFEPSIQIDPDLALEAERVQEERRAAKEQIPELFETADTTLPGSPPTRGEGLRLLLERAGTGTPVKKTPAPKLGLSNLSRGPDETHVARPSAGRSTPAGAKRPLTGSAPRAQPPSASPRAPSPLPPSPSVELDTAIEQVSAPEESEPPTAELTLPELEEHLSDEVPAPVSEDELELTRPLPALTSAELKGIAPLRAFPTARPSGLPPIKAAPPPRFELERAPPSLSPLKSSPPGPLRVSGAASQATALVPLPPVSGALGSPLPFSAPAPIPSLEPLAPGMVATAPEISLRDLPDRIAPPAGLIPPDGQVRSDGQLHSEGPVRSEGPVHSEGPVRSDAQPFGAPPPAQTASRFPRNKLIVGGAVVAVLLSIVLVILIATSGPSALDQAVLVVSEDGRPASYEAALTLAPADGSDRERATRAMLLASATLELGVDHGSEADQLLGSLDPEASASPEARIARSLVAVSRGQGAQALTVLAGLGAEGAILVEAFRARALAEAQVGELGEAVDAARQAATLAPGAPRHAALYAELSLLNGDASGAQRVLDGMVGIDGVATLRLVRAELGMLNGADPNLIGADLDAVMGPLATSSTAPELGRVHLARAQLALARHETEAARNELEFAATLLPNFDARRRLQLAEAMLDADAPARALEVATALTGETSDPAARAEVVVRAALAAGDVPAAERAVGAAGAGPRIDFLRARIAESQGRNDEARRLYGLAAADPGTLVAARTAEGRLFLAAGRARDAIAVLAQALATNSQSPEAVLLFARASLINGDVASAERAVAAAASANGEEPRILAASGLVAGAGGRFEQAYQLLVRASGARPDDAGMLVELGEAAVHLSRLDEAGRAFRAAAALPSPPPAAHVGLALLAIESGAFDAASSELDRATGAPELEVTRARARLLVARGVGHGGIDEVTRVRHRRASDPVLATALAALQVQAEDDRRARATLRPALRTDPEDPEALVISALVDAHEGRAASARESLSRAERSAAARGALPSVRARIAAVRGRLSFDAGEASQARTFAEEAIRLDPRCAEAHLLLADLEIEASRDPIPELRLALAGTAPPGEAVGRLALRLGDGEEACALGRRYLAIAPSGYDARNVNDLLRRCP